MPIPPEYQLFASILIGVLVALGAVYKFFSDLKRPPSTSNNDHLRVWGAALGDSQALTAIADELREIRALVQRQIDLDKSNDLAFALLKLSDTINQLGRRWPK